MAGAQLIASRAIGGIDALGARLSALSGAILAQAAAGFGPARQRAPTAELAGLTEAQQIFSGSAREAARQFPKNAKCRRNSGWLAWAWRSPRGS